MGLTWTYRFPAGVLGRQRHAACLVTAVIAYFCGCFNGAVIVSKYILRDDVRSHGSGNAGLTNFYRTFGGPLTFVVILARRAQGGGGGAGGGMAHRPAAARQRGSPEPLPPPWPSTGAGLFCLLGHMFPCMFQFQGGQGHPVRRHHRHHD